MPAIPARAIIDDETDATPPLPVPVPAPVPAVWDGLLVLPVELAPFEAAGV